eukprot:5839108-Amphidinium_carterae.1
MRSWLSAITCRGRYSSLRQLIEWPGSFHLQQRSSRNPPWPSGTKIHTFGAWMRPWKFIVVVG